MKKVEGFPDLCRDDNGAIINTNKTAYYAAKQKKAADLRQKEELEILRSEVDALKNLVQELLDGRS